MSTSSLVMPSKFTYWRKWTENWNIEAELCCWSFFLVKPTSRHLLCSPSYPADSSACPPVASVALQPLKKRTHRNNIPTDISSLTFQNLICQQLRTEEPHGQALPPVSTVQLVWVLSCRRVLLPTLPGVILAGTISPTVLASTSTGPWPKLASLTVAAHLPCLPSETNCPKCGSWEA